MPGDGFPVLSVVHERVKPVGSGGSCGKYHELGIVAVSPNDFLPPIAENIGGKAGRGFGPVIGGRIVIGGA